MIDPKYTHYGWFMWCPVYIGSIDSDAPYVESRWWVPEWWFWLNEFVFGLCTTLMTMIDDDYEPLFPFKITGEIK